MMKKTILLVLAMCLAVSVGAVETFVSFTPVGGGFAVVKGGKPVNVVCGQDDFEGVQMAVANLADDFCRVSGTNTSTRPRRGRTAGSYSSSLRTILSVTYMPQVPLRYTCG